MRSDKLIFEAKLKCYESVIKKTGAPLDVIRNLLENVLSKDTSLTVAREIRWILVHINRLIDRYSHMVGYNKVNGCKYNKLHTHEYELHSYITSLVNQFRKYADKRHVQLKVCKGYGCIGCSIDEISLTTALQVLFKKVIDATPWSGCVNIEVSQLTDQWSVHITNSSDTEKGYYGKFRQFYKQLISAHFDKHRHIRQLIRFHGGRISGYGQGSSIHYVLTLPIVNRESTDMEDNSKRFHASCTNVPNPPHIVLIMNNKEFGAYLEKNLSFLYRITIIDDCSEVKGSLLRHQADVVIIDESLSCISAIELCSQIKSDKSMFNVPVILLLENETDEDYDIYRKSRADWVISHAIHIRQLKTLLQTLIKERIRVGDQLKKVTNKKSTPVLSQIKTISEKDACFVERLDQLLNEHLSDEDYKVEMLAADMGMSRTVFYYNMKRIFGKSPQRYIYYFKMEKAQYLLLTQQHSIKEITFLLGFSTPKYFGKEFRKYTGFSPTEYLKKNLGEDFKVE